MIVDEQFFVNGLRVNDSLGCNSNTTFLELGLYNILDSTFFPLACMRFDEDESYEKMVKREKLDEEDMQPRFDEAAVPPIQGIETHQN